MSLTERIDTKLTEAMRSGDSVLVGNLRMLKASIKNAAIAAQKELQDDEVIRVLQKEVKQRQDAAQSYDDAKRPELAKKERDEIAIIREFLPEAPSEDQVREVIARVIKENGATSMAQMGVVIAAARTELGAAADGAQIAAEAKQQLAGD